MSLRVQIVAPEAIRAAVNALREVDEKLPNRMRLLLRRVAQPIMREQRRLIRAMPTKSGGRSRNNLRRKIASGVRLKLRTGRDPIMRIRTQVPFAGKKNQGGMLPRGMDTFFDGFDAGPPGLSRRQTGYGPSWFMGPPAAHQRDAERQVKALLDMSANEVRRAAAVKQGRGRPPKITI